MIGSGITIGQQLGSDRFNAQGGLTSVYDCGQDVFNVEVESATLLGSHKPAATVTASHLYYMGDGTVGYQISLISCSSHCLNSVFDLLKRHAALLEAVGCETVCCVYDEVDAAIQGGRRVEDALRDAIVTIQKSGEEPPKCHFQLLELGHELADHLPEGFASCFAEAVNLVAHTKQNAGTVDESQSDEGWFREWGDDL